MPNDPLGFNRVSLNEKINETKFKLLNEFLYLNFKKQKSK